MGKTSFQTIQKLISEIETGITKLNKGQLSVSEIDSLVHQAADLHERLAVVRYKAFEKFGEPIHTPEVPEKTEKAVTTETEPSIDFGAMNETLSEPIISVEEPELPTLDFSQPLFDLPKTEKKEIPVQEPEIKKPIHVIREEIKQESASLHEKFLKDDDVDLNDKLKREDTVPLRKKLGLTPIQDLRAEIGIGKKFEYINFLFAGDAKAYETAIDELNQAGSAGSAKQKLNVYASVYQWDLEEKTIVKFIELVERRYLG